MQCRYIPLGNAPAGWILHMSIWQELRPNDTKCWWAKGSIRRSSVWLGKDIPLSSIWFGIYACTSFDREEEE